MPSNATASVLWFIAIIAMIPAALWLLKRSGFGARLGSAASAGPMRSVGVLALSSTQRIVTIEVGDGEARRWLVLGVTPQSISLLHTMEPQLPAATEPPGNTPASPFSQLLGRLKSDRGAPDGR